MRCVDLIGDLITHPRQQLERSPVAKFGIEFAFEYVEDVPQIAPVIRQVAGHVFHLAHPQITDGESAPDGCPGFAGMHRHDLTAPKREPRSFKDAVAALGRDPDKVTVNTIAYPVVAETRTEAEDRMAVID